MSTTTSVDNATTVASLYEAFGRGDIPFILDHLDDSCQWIAVGEGYLPTAGTYKGKDAVNFFMRLGDTVEFSTFNPTAIHNIGENEVVAFGNMSGKSKATGKPSSSDWAMHWKFNDEGKAIYFHEFHDTAAAYGANQA